MVECPTCAKKFDSEHGMKSHHGAKHNKPVPETGEHDCPNCHRAFDSKKGLRYHHTTVHGKSLTENQSTCEWCGTSFTYHKERDEGRFCSQECYQEWLHQEYLSGEDSPLANKVERTCDECGEVFKRQKSRADLNERDYCSRECYHANHSGEDAPNWKGGGVSYYGGNWLPQRRAALKRDDHECQDCGLSRDEHYEQYGKDLEVHHKTPIKTFEDTSDANQLSNLITVCMDCHIKRENRDD